MKFLVLLAAINLSSTFAAEVQIKDSNGITPWLYTPTEKPDATKTYWLAVGVHGAGGDGKGAGGIAHWAKDDVIVLGPSFAQPKPDKDAPKTEKMPAESFQMNGPTHDAKLKALIAEAGKTWKLHPKVFLHGFSAGAQFAHRFAMQNPELVAGVSAASAGSWSTRGFGEINPVARGIPFALSCGEYDRDKSDPGAPLSRLEWMKEFAVALKEQHFDVESRVLVNTGHKANEDTMALAVECFQRARAVNFSRTVMLALDFNEANPLWQLSSEAVQPPKGSAVTAEARWDATVGVIEKQGTAERTGALRLRVNSLPTAKTWSGTLHSGLLPIHHSETDLAKLTLAFDLSSSVVRPVRVHIASYDAAHERTGLLEGIVHPAAPDFYQRHTLDLAAMKQVGEGEFQAHDPFVQISFAISSDLGWAATSGHEVLIDNLSYAAPAFYVSPAGDDKANDGRSAEKPFATVQKAVDLAQPGDITLLMDGEHTAQKYVANIKGTGVPAAWLVLKKHPGHKPVLRTTFWDAIKVGQGNKSSPSTAPGSAYIEVRGLTVRGYELEVEAKFKDKIGKAEPETNGNGISFDGRFQNAKPHHIRIADCEVYECPGGGINAIKCDWVTIENNHSHHNCHWMIYAGSGISMLGSSNFDATIGGYRMMMRNNRCHDNHCTQPWVAVGKLSDGNGMIVDDNRNTQSTNIPFTGRFLVTGNVSYRNGGSGMHCFSSDRVDFINNTCVGNNTVMDYSQLGITSCSDVRVLNNIIVATMPDKPANRANGRISNILISHNLIWGGNGEQVPGEHAILADPLFMDAAKDDYRLKKDSPALGKAAVWEISPFGAVDLGNWQQDPEKTR